MAIISFSKTRAEFLSGKKTMTRRDWSCKQFNIWRGFWKHGNLIHDAYDNNPRNGGLKIGEFQLTCFPYREMLQDMTEDDLKAEGGMCKTIEEFCKFIGKTPETVVTVIRFKKI